MSAMKVLYKDETWWLSKDENVYWLRHTCTLEKNIQVRRGKHSTFDQFKSAEIPCSFCLSVCPKSLQGMYNMLEYL